MTTLPSLVQRWQNSGRFINLNGHSVFCRDNGLLHAPVLVLLHGFPSSSYDWHSLWPLLPSTWRIVVFDFLGYGLSDKPQDYSYSLFEQADLVELLLKHLGIKSAHLLAHDMGTSVCCELLARRERGLLSFQVDKLLLMNGSVHIELAQLTPSQKLLRTRLGAIFARLSSEFIFNLQLQRIVSQPLSHDELKAMWALLTHNNGKLRLPQTIRYIDERYRFQHRWIGALTRLNIPTTILWGQRDPVAVAAIAQQLAREIPQAELRWLPTLGHYPQLEDPQAVAEEVIRFLQT